MRSDKKRNAINVLKEVINSKEPISQRDIADKTDLGLGTVNRAINELEQNGTLREPEIIDFVKSDLLVQSLAQKEIIKRLEKTPNDLKDNDIKGYAEFAFKRSQILQGKATERIDIDGGEILKQIQSGKIGKESAYDLLKQTLE